MNVIADTSVWIDFFRGEDVPLLEDALREGRVFLTPVIVAELVSGVAGKAEEKRLLDLLRDLPVCEAPPDHWIEVGRLRRKLSAKGFAVSTPDAHIAQAAVEMRAGLLTRDRIFFKIAALADLHVSDGTMNFLRIRLCPPRSALTI